MQQTEADSITCFCSGVSIVGFISSVAHYLKIKTANAVTNRKPRKTITEQYTVESGADFF